MNRKICAFILALLLIITGPINALLIISAQALSVPVFTIEEKSNDGETLVATINVENGSFSALNLKFQMTGIECVSIEQGEALNAAKADVNITDSYNVNITADGKSNISFACTPEYEAQGELYLIAFKYTSIPDYSFDVDCLKCYQYSNGKYSKVTPEITSHVCFEQTTMDKTKFLTYSERNGEITITGCTLPFSTIEIPAEIDGYPVTKIANNIFSNFDSYCEIEVPDSVTSIDDRAFYRVLNVVYNGESSGAPWGAKAVNGYIEDGLVYEDDSKKVLLGCSYLKEGGVEIPDSVISIGESAFEDCAALTSVTIGENVTNIGDKAFMDCSGIESIIIPDSVTSIGVGAFGYCSSLSEIIIPDSVISIGESAFEDCTALTSVTIGENVISIGDCAFMDCSGIESIIIPDSVISIGESAFEDCTALTSVTIGDNVTNISNYAFYNCTGLTNVSIPDSVTDIGDSAFEYCTGLENIEIGNNVTYIGENAFYNCKSITNITIPDNVTYIGEMAFAYCNNLSNIEIGNNVECIADEAFYCCSVKYIYIPSSVQYIGELAFLCFDWSDEMKEEFNSSDCETVFYSITEEQENLLKSSIVSIKVEKNNQYYDSRNDCNAIIETESNCLLLGCINTLIPDDVIYIGEAAFAFCSDITNIIVPESVIGFYDYAFAYCSNLKDVYYAGSTEQWNEIEIGDNEELLNADIHFGWKKHYNIIYNANGGIVSTENENIEEEASVILPTPTKNYTITYNANGGGGVPSAQIVPITCKGWSTDSDATSVDYLCGESYTVTEDVTFYAVWNNSVNSTVSSIEPVKSGYNFLGWSVNCNDTTAIYEAGSSISVAEDTMLYAIWEEIPYYTVSYNANSGTVTSESVSIIYGDSTVLPTPTKNYTITYNANGGSGAPSAQIIPVTCKGWSTDIYATSADYLCGESYTVTEDTTLYAVWRGFENSTISSVVPVRSGYTFKQWSNQNGGASAFDPKYYTPGESIMVSEDMTLYAQWQILPTLSYNANGGSGAPSSQTGSDQYTISSTVPTRFPYTFDGWSLSNSATGATYGPGDAISLSSSATLYAVWTSAPSISTHTEYSVTIEFPYQVRYYMFCPVSSATYTFESNGSLDSYATLYDDSGSQLAYNDDGGTDYNFKLSSALTAGETYYIAVKCYGTKTGTFSFNVQSQQSQRYTITYNANGGSVSTTSTYSYDDMYITLPTPTRSGYICIGWANSSTASASYECGSLYKPTASVTLYAVWQKVFKYGNYPQSEVTSSSIKSALDAIEKDWISYGYYSGSGTSTDGNMLPSDYMKYCDICYNGNKYRAVKFTSYRPSNTGYKSSSSNSYQDDNGYYTNTVYYFKFEPLTWRVLDSSTGLIMCDSIIDAQPYTNYVLKSGEEYYGDASKTYYACNYYYSSLRKWLNEDFYNTALNDSQKNNIKVTHLNNNSYSSSYSQYNAPESDDKIFLLSRDETTKSNYGFATSASKADIARAAQGTSYAQSQGLQVDDRNSRYWLRSPATDSYRPCETYLNGNSSYYIGAFVTTVGVRPVCQLTNLQADTSQTIEYKVSYDANGGSGAPSSQKAASSCTISSTVPTNIPYTFLGWSKSSSAVYPSYLPGDNINLTSDMTLYAVWGSASSISTRSDYSATIEFSYQVRYYKFCPASSATYTFESNGSLDTYATLYDASGSKLSYNDDGGTDYNFKLSYALTAGETYYIAVKCYGTKTGTFSFNVKSQQSQYFTVTYKGNGGIVALESEDVYNGEVTVLPAAERDGYFFLGWSTDSDAVSAIYYTGDIITPSSDTILYAVWQEIIEFGSYPQSKVTDSTTISALDNISKNWISYGYYSGTGYWYDGNMEPSDYMKYADIYYNGNKYRAVTFSSYRPKGTGKMLNNNISETYQDDNGYYFGNIYYFKYEPLTWRVLDSDNGYVMCTKAIDSQAFSNYVFCEVVSNMQHSFDAYGAPSRRHYASDWENSSLREWLNNDFYNTAFSEEEKAQIGVTLNENKGTSSKASDGADTLDKVFLLSYYDAINSSYGFSTSLSADDPAKQIKSTDYAKCQGCYTNTSTDYYGNSEWQLRSPYDSLQVKSIKDYSTEGKLIFNVTGTPFVEYTYYGVVPAFKFRSEFSVTYNANGGSVSQESETVYDGDSVVLPVPVRSGYVFLGWYTQADGGEQVSDSMPITSDMTLFAHWRPEELLIPKTDSTVIDNGNKLIYGVDAGLLTIKDYAYAINGYAISEVPGNLGFGTDSKVNVMLGDETVESYTIVVFGDVNGDGWYDGTDSIIVNCLANGLLSREQVGEAVYMAADCNHDNVIDENDVALLEQAGLILVSVDQSKSEAELMTDSAYVEYLNLIDQNPTEETPVEETPTDVTPTDEPVDVKLNVFDWLIGVIIRIINYIKLHFSIIK